ncbi:hypothetical protein [Flavobacterium rhizosphaerae]|uniref:DUF4823 domain-containing protein n=1 Tax=Flavobacterium rhizosphaerae TaxID=3163298 RepID=A0ABW8YWL7_9FLAO
MSELFERAKASSYICGIALAFSGTVRPSSIEGYQPFYNSLPDGTQFQEAYFGKASVQFSEASDESNAGYSYQQTLAIKFPGSDKRRPERLAEISKAIYIMVRLSNGRSILMGRNDFEQNARPKILTKTDERLAQAQFITYSIFPSGYTPDPNAAGLPEFLPIDLIE